MPSAIRVIDRIQDQADFGGVPQNGYVLTYNSSTGKFEPTAPASSGAPTNASYITKVAESGLSAEFALGSLASGYLKVATTTGDLSSQATPIPPADGGTGTANTGNLAWPSGGGTAALLGAANSFTVGPQTINTGGAGNKGVVVKLASSPTANAFEVQDNGSTALTYIRKDGSMRVYGDQVVAGDYYTLDLFWNKTPGGNKARLAIDAIWNDRVRFTPISTGSENGTVIFCSSTNQSFQFIDSNREVVFSPFAITLRGSVSPGAGAIPGSAGVIPWAVRGYASQTANLEEWQDSSGGVLATVTENGYFTTRKTSAPADAELATGELAFWFDSTAGAAKMMIKAKNASGTVVTGSVTLT